MEDRNFNEVDLRTMLEHARAYGPDIVEGRWVIVSQHNRHALEIIVEPDSDVHTLVIVTAYPVWE